MTYRRGDRVAFDMRAAGETVTLTAKIVAFGLIREEIEGAIVRVDKTIKRHLPRAPGQSLSSHVGCIPITSLRRV